MVHRPQPAPKHHTAACLLPPHNRAGERIRRQKARKLMHQDTGILISEGKRKKTKTKQVGKRENLDTVQALFSNS